MNQISEQNKILLKKKDRMGLIWINWWAFFGVTVPNKVHNIDFENTLKTLKL